MTGCPYRAPVFLQRTTRGVSNLGSAGGWTVAPGEDRGHGLRVQGLGKLLVVAGLSMAALGALVWWLGPRLGAGGGLLPGDMSFRRGGFSLHFPIVTCLVVSVLLTLISRLFQR